jgi:hypothetical protein
VRARARHAPAKKLDGCNIPAHFFRGVAPASFPAIGQFNSRQSPLRLPVVRNVSVLTIFWILPIVAPDVVPRSQGEDPGNAMANDPN